MSTAATQSGEWIDIPGYPEVLRQEAEIRRAAFSNAPVSIAGIPVRPLTLGLLLELEASRVAFVNPWKFESGLELAAECARFIWHVSEIRKHTGGTWSRLRGWRIRDRVIRQVSVHPDALGDLRAYLDRAMHDAPYEGGGTSGPAFTHWAAGVMDMLAAGGYAFSHDEVMAMPLARVWQFFRRAKARTTDMPMLNPSDAWASEQIAAMQKR